MQEEVVTVPLETWRAIKQTIYGYKPYMIGDSTERWKYEDLKRMIKEVEST